MPSHRSHLLSIALTPSCAQIAEAKRAGAGVSIVRRSTLMFAPDAGLDAPAALGVALSEHLKQQGYGTKHAVIGLCPRWVLARHKHAPPADADALRGIVNLQVEREFAGSASEMRFDYVIGGPAGEDGQVPLLLAAVRRGVLSQVELVAKAAGLAIEAITPTTFAAADPGRSGAVAVIEPGVAGVMRVQGGAVIGLASCPAEPDTLADADARDRLLAHLSRCALQLPSVDPAGGLMLVLPSSVTDADARALAESAAERFGEVDVEHADAADRLAGHAMRQGVSLIDFSRSRLAPPKRRRVSERGAWLIRAAVLVLLIGGTAGYLWIDATARRDALQAEYDAIKDRADELKALRADTRLAEPWFDERLPAHDVLLELTRTFPTDGQIRVETLTIQADLDCQIQCTAEDRRTMDRYFSQIQESTRLLRVDLGGYRPAGGRDNWVDFPIEFRYDPKAKGGRL
ncbi:MAG: hypothetical protein ACE37H_12175 [Phycisphaeraceae bacterium]